MYLFSRCFANYKFWATEYINAVSFDNSIMCITLMHTSLAKSSFCVCHFNNWNEFQIKADICDHDELAFSLHILSTDITMYKTLDSQLIVTTHLMKFHRLHLDGTFLNYVYNVNLKVDFEQFTYSISSFHTGKFTLFDNFTNYRWIFLKFDITNSQYLEYNTH